MHGTGTTEHEQLARQRLARTAHDAVNTPRVPQQSHSLRRRTAAGLRRIAEQLDG